ncbi:MAG TPA: hypothetical protein VMB91_07775 [Solirubrobacteraceae bacterium]|nr:hypothetical protein [Solirubrobacteraceae bacterium]
MITKTALAGQERTGDELIVWRAAVARARGALSKTFEGKMEAALASFDVVPQHGRGAAGRTLSDFAAEVGISYGALDQYRQVLRWLGDFVHVYEIPSYSLARVAQVSGRWRSGAEFARFIEREESPSGLPWTVSALRVFLNEHPGEAPPEHRAGRGAGQRRGRPEGEPPRAREGGPISGVAARAAKKVEGLIAKGVSTSYPEEQDVCWKKASDLIRAHDLTVAVSPAR